MIETWVGTERRVIDLDVYLGVHAGIVVELRARGLAGEELDHALVALLPHRLARLLDGGGMLH